MNTDMKKYYGDRARVYDKSFYSRDEPDRLNDIAEISKALKKLFKGKNIIEVACGTGHWTKILSGIAKGITATDAVSEMLKIAKTKKYKSKVNFQIADAYSLPFEANSFDAGVANFWFSHILKKDTALFLKEFHRVLKSGSTVFLCDNVNHKERVPLIKKGEDTFRIRDLGGVRHEVVKNYYNQKTLEEIFPLFAKSFKKENIFIGKFAWYVWYELEK